MLISNTHHLGTELTRLLHKQIDTPVRRDGIYLKAVGIRTHHVQSLRADTTRTAQYRYLFHVLIICMFPARYADFGGVPARCAHEK